ncbi:uncharacterized protein H6S33_005471 [Morchella sextelata]|uniref:uncharacterized protein n=1 Tax=Morchella sextelata TaxID=1174677 RepID=UPI001D039854|nr:uncharacterized protein H6S33_005471 [Morchella sextelata]KAH0613585.1 hypothetical protein H6S33_005471 [Morchella sextelata]
MPANPHTTATTTAPAPAAGTANDINKTRHGTRETGFPEPLSLERNTTLPHQDAQTAPHEELDTAVISEKHHRHRPHVRHHHNRQKAERAQAEMYSGLEVEENVDAEGKGKGLVKRVLGRLSCGAI